MELSSGFLIRYFELIATVIGTFELKKKVCMILKIFYL